MYHHFSHDIFLLSAGAQLQYACFFLSLNLFNVVTKKKSSLILAKTCIIFHASYFVTCALTLNNMQDEQEFELIIL